MNRLTKIVVACMGSALIASPGAAAPPPPKSPPPPPVRIILPTTPRPYFPVVPRPVGGVVVFPSTTTLRPPVVPVQPMMYTVYYRYVPYGAWIPYTSTSSWWRAESIRDMLLFSYGVEAVVF